MFFTHHFYQLKRERLIFSSMHTNRSKNNIITRHKLCPFFRHNFTIHICRIFLKNKRFSKFNYSIIMMKIKKFTLSDWIAHCWFMLNFNEQSFLPPNLKLLGTMISTAVDGFPSFVCPMTTWNENVSYTENTGFLKI